MRKQGSGIIICMDIEITKNYDRTGFAVNDTMSGTKIFKKLEGDDLVAHSCLEKEGMICNIM